MENQPFTHAELGLLHNLCHDASIQVKDRELAARYDALSQKILKLDQECYAEKK